MNNIVKGKLSSHEETRSQFSGSQAMIKLGIDPAAAGPGLYVVIKQQSGSNPKPPQR
jgi:hypothetical protein